MLLLGYSLSAESSFKIFFFWMSTHHEEDRAKIRQAIGPHVDLLTIVKRRNLQRYGNVSRSSGLAKTIVQGTVKGGRRQGRQKKRWEDNIREWTGLGFAKSQRPMEDREKWRKPVVKSSVVPQRPSRLRDRWWRRIPFVPLSPPPTTTLLLSLSLSLSFANLVYYF